MKKFYAAIFGIAICYSSFSQQLTANYGATPFKMDWQRAGYPGDTVPSYALIRDITAYGGDKTGVASNNAAFTSAVNSLGGANGVIYFPPGNYFFTATLFLRGGLILRGAGSGQTTLTFQLPLDGDLIRASGTVGASTAITAAVQQYGNQVTVANPDIIPMGSFVKIYQNNESSLITSSWADNAVGQFSYVKSKSGNNVTLYTRHRRGVPLSGAPIAQVVNMIKGVGVECLKIKRIDADQVVNQTSNIYFNYAAFCWVKGVESDSANFAHVNIMNSTNIEVTGSFFHGAFSYGSGGVGYGVVCQMTTGDCLIENNIFRNLRHAMLLQAGTNGNIYAYNYALAPKRTEFPSDASLEIVLHGNYTYANLFEGNIAQNIGGDASHGKNGPGNVFFRNRALRYGIVFTSGSGDSSIVIYNEATGSGGTMGLVTTAGSNTIASRNYRQSAAGYVGNAETKFTPNVATTYTHFLEPVRPYFFSADLQPIGYPGPYNAANSIPAMDRFVAGGIMTYCSNRSRKDSMMPVNCNPLAIASAGGYDVHDLSETTEFRDNSNCGLIASISPNGSNPVSGYVTTKTTVDATVQFYNGKPFVQRHYDIEPFNNAATATGRITLYFTQQDFNNYNAVNDVLDRDLPTGPADADGKAGLRVTQYHGVGSAPGNYSGSSELIDPNDADIVWNATTSLWQVSFDVTGFSGFFVNGIAAPLPVTLVSFRYSLPGEKKVELKWDVVEQVDIRKYIVERSANGRNYLPIGAVTANDERSYTYRFTDNDPLDAVNYYRLQIVEDNVKSYSRILVVDRVKRKNALTIFPVPARNQVTISLGDSELLNSEAQLVTVSGLLVRKIKLQSFAHTIDILTLPAGVYYLKTSNGKAYKILKQ